MIQFKLLFIFISLSLSLFAVSAEKRDLIEALVIKTSNGSISNMMEPMTNVMLSNMLSTVNRNYQIEDKDLKILEYRLIKFFNKVMYSAKSTNKLVDLLVPVYDKYYSKEDLKQLIRFYDSDIGKKTIEVMPLLLADSALAGQEWSELVFLPKQDECVELIYKTLVSLGYE